MAKRTLEVKTNAEMISKLANEGFDLKGIREKLGITYNVIDYALKNVFGEEEAKKIKEKINNNRKSNNRKIKSEKITKVNLKEQVIEVVGKNNQKEKIALIDTSMMGVSDFLDTAKKEKMIIAFPSIVIEELDNIIKSRSSEAIFQAKRLIFLALEQTSLVFPSKPNAKLEGWQVMDNDSIIIKCGMDLSEKYDVSIFTADKLLAIKAKSQSLKYMYFKIDEECVDETKAKSTKFKKHREFKFMNSGFFNDLEFTDQIICLPMQEKEGQMFLEESTDFPHYFITDKNGNIQNPAELGYLIKEDSLIFEIGRRSVRKILVDSSKTIKCIVEGEFINEVNNINTLSVNSLIKSLITN